MNCPFCYPDAERVAFHATLTLGIWDRFPVADGHALVVPLRHVSRWADLTPAERLDLLDGVERMREILPQRLRAALA